ncbi:glycoside hydrolase family 52 protein [Paenibacillus pasadenensis]|uniref:Beta-xylosidase n=1 Tax=Paenibacillus pasadenensis TaxID=217090 RepID=A0A2N5N353_9BACL|nr:MULTISPECIES: glycoside hydrolase family 52 protein [Paenibacillus]PLT44771.1 Beta-xylosidase [Paenibacillus pasadenensis]QGG55234.1 beta-xylosidase [Paenibacillus sp. B01]
MSDNRFYNAHHAPIGAFASFTLGYPGAKGGLGLELGRPADQNVYIGLQSRDGSRYEALPFYGALGDEAARYDVEKKGAGGPSLLQPFAFAEIGRSLSAGEDVWEAGDLTFRILSPVRPVPDPAAASEEELKAALVPAVFAELTVDNTAGRIPRRAFFGYEGNDPYSAMRPVEGDGFSGVGQGRITAIAAPHAPGVRTGFGFSMESILTARHEQHLTFGLGGTGALLLDTPAGERRTFRFAVCFYRGGIATSGLDASYLYTRWFGRIEDVAAYALEHYEELAASCRAAEARWSGDGLSADQRFMLDHAIHSYYGSTQLLDVDGEPMWIVNEGEYRMMNTLDLTADQLFFELELNPWTVRNELDWFVKRYSYRDTVRFPGDAEEHPGGIAFTHDMGVANVFSPPGRSAYELAGIDGCFSYMSHEELVNWLCCALVYLEQTGDREFLERALPVLQDGLESMLRRDHPDPSLRNGLMGLDSSRTDGGAEITTYDSLDVSLGQSRNNIYMAGKCWAVYVALEKRLAAEGLAGLAAEAGAQADRAAATIAAQLNDRGYIPAVIGENNDSRIIPAIEGLVFPYFTGARDALDPNGRFSVYLAALRTHLATVLQEGTCLFPDGGWKLSSTSDNSWLSKIYLCQFIAREILGLPWEEQGAAADAAHAAWLKHPELSYWAWSDQILAGEIIGSKYYPRGVTAILWLRESGSRALAAEGGERDAASRAG